MTFNESLVIKLLIAAVMLSVPLLHHQGTFSYGGFLSIVILFVFLYHVSLRKTILSSIKPLLSLRLIPLLILFSQILGFTFFDFDNNGIQSIAQFTFRASFLLAIVLSVSLFLSVLKNPGYHENNWSWKLYSLFFLALVLRVSIIRIVREPAVDIFEILKYGSLALIHGRNPYQMNFGGFLTTPTLSGVTSFITYWPMAIYPFVPSAFFSLDPRVVLISAEMVLSILLYQELKAKKAPTFFRMGIPLLFLYFPFFPVVTARSFVDPLILLFLYLAFRFRSKSNFAFFGLMLGVLASVKYLYVPPLIVFSSSLKRLKRNWKMFLVGTVTLVLFLAPFLVWDGQAFVRRTILDELDRQETYITQFGLGINGFIWTQFKTLVFTKYWMVTGFLGYLFLVWRKSFWSVELEYVITLFLLILTFPRPLGEQYYFLFGSILISASRFLIQEDKNKTI